MGRNLLILSLFFIMLNSHIFKLSAQHRTTVSLAAIQNQDLKFRMEENISELLTEFNEAYFEQRNPALNKNSLTQHAKESIESLWSTRPFHCNETNIYKNLIRRKDGQYEIRNVPLSIRLKDNTFHEEEGVFILTQYGKIDDLYFGLDHEQYNKLIKEGKNVTEFRRRQIILNFVEVYRTAYNRKDLNYIEKVFSDNALIIIGRVIEVQEEKSIWLEKSLGRKEVELIHLSKTEYIKKLSKVFKNNEFIKVGFDDIEIYQHPKFNEIYGVTLRQNWTSSNYSDQGYLFLMIDFKDENNPTIWVRSWQPNDTPEDEVIGLGDIRIY